MDGSQFLSQFDSEAVPSTSSFSVKQQPQFSLPSKNYKVNLQYLFDKSSASYSTPVGSAPLTNYSTYHNSIPTTNQNDTLSHELYSNYEPFINTDLNLQQFQQANMYRTNLSDLYATSYTSYNMY